jgi:hypothetical protein
MKKFKPVHILPLVLIGLIAGISGGWIRLGSVIIPLTEGAAQHGLLMVGGFLGTLISLERGMVMKHKVWFLVPIISGLSSLFLIAGQFQIGIILLIAASLGLSAIMHLQSVRHPHFHSYLIYLGAVCWFLGNFMVWYHVLIAAGTTWWIGFLLFTILGERLELSQFLPVPAWSRKLLGALAGLFFVGLVVPFHGWGNEILGVAGVLLAAWLLYFDMAKVAAKKGHQFRYIGIGLRVGYVWLLIHGLILLSLEGQVLYYDLLLHTFFLGFTFSMIWAHAPIIFPLIFGIRETPYHPILWWGWGIFQLTLAGRIASGGLGLMEWRKLFGVANGWAILGMFALMAGIVIWKIFGNRKTETAGDKNHAAAKESIRNFGTNA